MTKKLHSPQNMISMCRTSNIASFLAIQIIIGLVVVLILFVGILKLGEDVLQKEIFAFDATITTTIYQYRSEGLTIAMRAVTFLGSGIFIFGSSLLVIGYLYTKRKKDALIFSVLLASGIFLNSVLKLFFHRPRPLFLPLVHEDTYSFPSGHAMISCIFFVTVSYFIFRETKNIPKTFIISLISAILIACIGVSRVYLGAHYPSDVIAGYVSGIFWFCMLILIEKTIIFRRLYKTLRQGKKLS